MLATRGKPETNSHAGRAADNTGAATEHSRKPDEIYGRIERLVDGPYLEMLRSPAAARDGMCLVNETDKFEAEGDPIGCGNDRQWLE